MSANSNLLASGIVQAFPLVKCADYVVWVTYSLFDRESEFAAGQGRLLTGVHRLIRVTFGGHVAQSKVEHAIGKIRILASTPIATREMKLAGPDDFRRHARRAQATS